MLTRRAFLAGALAAVVAVTACSPGEEVPTPTPTPTPSPSLTASQEKPRELLWSEEFKHLDLASPANPRGRWRTNDVWQPLDKGYGDFATGQNSTWLVNPAQHIPGLEFNPFSLTENGLQISTRRTPADVQYMVNGCPWMGGMLISNTALPEMTFGYGYYEFRARFPTPAKGMFPAMWFYAARDQNPESQSTAEIDLFEIFGYGSGRPFQSTLHGSELVDVQTQDLDTAGWHTYGMDWTADHLNFYYDGKQTASAPAGDVEFFKGAKMSLRVNFVMDAQYFPPERRSDDSVPNTLHLELDYIRRYDRP